MNQFITTYNADVASYRQTVLTAFQQVEDYLAAVRILSQQILKQQQATNSAEEVVDAGDGAIPDRDRSLPRVVTAQTTLLSNQQTLATLHVQEMTASVQLIEALGGGWDRTHCRHRPRSRRSWTRPKPRYRNKIDLYDRRLALLIDTDAGHWRFVVVRKQNQPVLRNGTPIETFALCDGLDGIEVVPHDPCRIKMRARGNQVGDVAGMLYCAAWRLRLDVTAIICAVCPGKISTVIPGQSPDGP